jgi:hypothetical protein
VREPTGTPDEFERLAASGRRYLFEGRVFFLKSPTGWRRRVLEATTRVDVD